MMKALLEVASRHLPFGEGFGVGARYWLVQLNFAEQGLGGAHETISTLVLELGIPGVFLILLLLILVWARNLNVFHFSMTNWKSNPNFMSNYMLSLFVGAVIFYQTFGIFASSALVAGKWNWIIPITTLQVLYNQKITYTKNPHEQITHNINRDTILQ